MRVFLHSFRVLFSAFYEKNTKLNTPLILSYLHYLNSHYTAIVTV